MPFFIIIAKMIMPGLTRVGKQAPSCTIGRTVLWALFGFRRGIKKLYKGHFQLLLLVYFEDFIIRE